MGISDFVDHKDDKPFHSSGYAEVAHGGSIGSTSSESFSKRHTTEQNRRHIRRYSDSSVARGGDHLRNEIRHRLEGPDSLKSAGDPRHRTMDRQAFNTRGGAQSAPSPRPEPAAPPPKRGFSEPPGRSYNPYS